LAAVVDRTFDVCIVGGGAAGTSLAVELSRRGQTVLLVEAGGLSVEESDQDPYRSEVVGPSPHRGINHGRVRALGGTTKLWGGQILELDDADFGARSWVVGSGWPFSKTELKGYYAVALRLVGLGDSLSDSEVWAVLGLPNPSQLSADFETYFTRWCPEPDFGVLHADALASQDGPTVLVNATVTSTELADARVSRVSGRNVDGADFAVSAREFAFCLGGLETCRFFLQPSPGAPWDGHPMLGSGYQDHVDADVAVIRPIDEIRFHATFDNVYLEGLKYHPKLKLGVAAQERLGILGTAGTVVFDSPSDERLVQIKAVARRVLRSRGRELTLSDVRSLVIHGLRIAPTVARQLYRYVRKHRAYIPRDATMRLRVHCEQEPFSASRISLADTKDAFGLFRSRIEFRIADAELRAIEAFALQAQKSLSEAGLAELALAPDLGQPAFRARCRDANHHMSGMRMSHDPTDGLVDPSLRVHGTENLYICSAAVFPTSGFSNPTHTLLALALRLADHLVPGDER
jgi:choline dehydrogenase-like flavoprotein